MDFATVCRTLLHSCIISMEATGIHAAAHMTTTSEKRLSFTTADEFCTAGISTVQLASMTRSDSLELASRLGPKRVSHSTFRTRRLSKPRNGSRCPVSLLNERSA